MPPRLPSAMDALHAGLDFKKKNIYIHIYNLPTYVPSASAAEILLLGSTVSIFLIRSLEALDIEGQGEVSRSKFPFSISSNMPFSVSDK